MDSATPSNARQVKEAAEARFGTGAKPTGIVLTHGHLDHAGSARDLAEMWDVPIFAHPLEMRSVEFLAGLRPSVLGCGHGVPMSGPVVARQLSELAKNFPAPKHGRYAWQPAIADASGIRYLPPAPPDPLPKIAAGVGIAALGTVLAYRRAIRSPERKKS